MKKSRLIRVGLIVVLFFAMLHYSFGLFNRYNFITAYVDKWMGYERIIIYGELFKTDSINSALAPELGFKLERKAGCNVTQPFVNGVKDYNTVMAAGISERLGRDWEEALEEKVRLHSESSFTNP